jgi:hypothetical protein
MPRPRPAFLFGVLVVLCVQPLGQAREPFRYPEARHGKGELKYVNGVPVLTVAGTPEEIGEQVGTLAVKQAPQLINAFKEFLKARNLEAAWPLLAGLANGLAPQFPAHHLKELEATAKASGFDRDQFVVANTIADITKIGGCSTLLVDAGRSTTGGPLFGRNLDFWPVGNLQEYGLVTVYRQPGKHAFASVGFPGLCGCMSAMNDAGLCLAMNEVTSANDGSPKFNPKGTPLLLCFRRVLEECATVAEAEKLLAAQPRTTMANLTVCDKKGGLVLEVTAKNLVTRRPVEGICSCTNHFRTKELATSTRCRRFEILEQTRKLPRVGLGDVAGKLDEANQGDWTLQSMIFEPAALKLHVAFGKLPSSKLPLKVLEMAPFFQNGRAGR